MPKSDIDVQSLLTRFVTGTFKICQDASCGKSLAKPQPNFWKLELNSLDSDNFYSDNHHQIRRSLLPIMTKPVVKT